MRTVHPFDPQYQADTVAEAILTNPFTAEFLSLLASVGVESVQLPPRSSNLNARAEGFVRTINESCLDRLILFGEGSLRKAASEFMEHYHQERHH